MTANFLQAQGGKLGAADVTGVLREELAKLDPNTAAVNQNYHVAKTTSDVLEGLHEVERTRPRVGRAIVARLTGAVVGGQTAGATGAIGGALLGRPRASRRR